jgi:curved DNA-binding protein CbpA
MARPTPEAIFEPFRSPDEPHRPCQHSDCVEPGLHRAPKSRDQLTDYYWFCLEHIRAYNKAWDYFVGMSEDEIEAQRRVDTVWERPSWPLGADYAKAEEQARENLEREFRNGSAKARHKSARRRGRDEQALAVLNLERPITFPEIKARYIKLVKRLHPDANGGDKAAEEQLKLVNEAFSTLKHSFVQ